MRHTTNKHRNKIMFIMAASCYMAVAACGASEKKKEEKQEASQEAPAPVSAFVVTKSKLSAELQMPGELIPYQQTDLYAKVNGFIKKLYADVGSSVKQGQLLALMEAPELSSQLAGAESRLQAQQAIYTASKANYDRLYETSKTPGTISPNDLDQAKARKQADSAQWQSAKSALREVAETKNYLEIRAPFSGVISTRNVNEGAIAGPAGKGSDLPLFVLQDQRKLRLAVLVPESATRYINDKTKVYFSVKGLPNEKFTAMVKRSAGSLDAKLRAERIEMDIDNSSKKLLPGMITEVTIPTSGEDSSLVIPRSAVLSSTERIFVIKLNHATAQWVDVKTGRSAEGKIEVFGSLSPGDTLLKTASEEIRNGSAIPAVTVSQ